MSIALELYVFSKRLQFADNELILLLMSCTTQHFKVLLQALALFPGMLIIIAESKRNVTITLRIFCLIQSAEMQIHMEVGKMLLYVYERPALRFTALSCVPAAAQCNKRRFIHIPRSDYFSANSTNTHRGRQKRLCADVKFFQLGFTLGRMRNWWSESHPVLQLTIA